HDSLFFFFQAEDGIRDFHVTGVQTCALPIWMAARISSSCSSAPGSAADCAVRLARRCLRSASSGSAMKRAYASAASTPPGGTGRSEERRVGEEDEGVWTVD